MSLLQINMLPFTWDCIRPISSLLHKFLPLPKGSGLCAYEVKDLEVRSRLLQPGFPGCVPPWPMTNDVMLIQSFSHTSSSRGFCHVVISIENKRVKVSFLRRDHRWNRRWKVELDDEGWNDWSCCVVLCPWIVVVEKKAKQTWPND